MSVGARGQWEEAAGTGRVGQWEEGGQREGGGWGSRAEGCWVSVRRVVQ